MQSVGSCYFICTLFYTAKEIGSFCISMSTVIKFLNNAVWKRQAEEGKSNYEKQDINNS